jgi:hypothetical protein
VIGGQRSSALGLAATLRHGDLPRRHRRQEGGVGVRGARGEEVRRGARMNAMELAGGGGTFYRAG